MSRKPPLQTIRLSDGSRSLIKVTNEFISQIIETIAVMLATACVIPVLALAFMIWFVQMLFGVIINIPREMPKKMQKE